MKKLALALVFVPLAAFAGKEEREYMKSDVAPAVTAAQTEFKKACGCDLKITVDEATAKTKDDMRQCKYIVEKIGPGATAHCTDAASKAAVCKMKSLKVAKAAEAKFTMAGSAGTATTDGQSNVTWDMMVAELDK